MARARLQQQKFLVNAFTQECDALVNSITISDATKVAFIRSELAYFSLKIESLKGVNAGTNQHTGAIEHPLQTSLIDILSVFLSSGNRLTNRDMTRIIFNSHNRINVKADHFSSQFKASTDGKINRRVTEYCAHSLIFYITESPIIPDAAKILMVAEIESYIVLSKVVPNKMKNTEYYLYRKISFALTKEALTQRALQNPKVKLPYHKLIFTREAISLIISKGNDKNLVGRAINTMKPYSTPDLGKMYMYVKRSFSDQALIDMCLGCITRYTIARDALSKLWNSKKSSVLFDGRPYKGSLYGFGWHSKHKQKITVASMQESFNIDAFTGEVVIDGVPHHIRYDKSKTDFEDVIWVSARTNRLIINNPPAQKYFAQPVALTPGAREDMNTLLAAKAAFGRGMHAPHWGDIKHKFYNPKAIRRFYWYKYNIIDRGLGYGWLNSGHTDIPSNFRPQEYLDALNQNP